MLPRAAEKTGTIPCPSTIDVQSQPSGHAMLIVGYDMDEKVYFVRNSWGQATAQNGYINIPFDVMASTPTQISSGRSRDRAIAGLSMFGPSVKESVDKVISVVKTPDALERCG
jgi:hypothetical protein